MPAVADPPKPRIPKLASLTGAATPAVAEPPKTEPTAPVTPPKVEPPPGPELPEIPTTVIGAGTPKSEAAIIEQRRLAKKAREEAAGATNEGEQFKIELATTKAALEKAEAERARLEQERKDFEALAKTREQEAERYRGTYAETQRPSFNAADDETFQTAHGQMMDALKSFMPARIKTPAGDQRVFFDVVANGQGKLQGLHNVLDSFSRAQASANEEGMDLAVNAMAQWLGADVDISKADQKEWRMLDKADPAFIQIEQALLKAAPHYQTKAQRYAEVQRDAPVLAMRKFEERQRGLQETLKQGIFLPTDEAIKRLRANPDDSEALFSLIVEQSPELKAQTEALLSGYSETFATVRDDLYLPTLKSNSRADVEAHQAQIMQHRARVANGMRNAIRGELLLKMLPVIIAERDAAEERATKASENTNPGGSSGAGGAGDGKGVLPAIPTKIVGAGMP